MNGEAIAMKSQQRLSHFIRTHALTSVGFSDKSLIICFCPKVAKKSISLEKFPYS